MITIAYSSSEKLVFVSPEDDEETNTICHEHNTIEFLKIICQYTNLGNILDTNINTIFWKDIYPDNDFYKWMEFKTMMMFDNTVMSERSLHDMFVASPDKYSIIDEIYSLLGRDFYNVVYKFYEQTIMQNILNDDKTTTDIIELYRNILFYETVYMSKIFSLDDKVYWMACDDYELLLTLLDSNLIDIYTGLSRDNIMTSQTSASMFSDSDYNSDEYSEYDHKSECSIVHDNCEFNGDINDYFCELIAIGCDNICETIDKLYQIHTSDSIIYNNKNSYTYKLANIYKEYTLCPNINTLIRAHFTKLSEFKQYRSKLDELLFIDLVMRMCENDDCNYKLAYDRYIERWFSITTDILANNTNITHNFAFNICERDIVLSDTLKMLVGRMGILHSNMDYIFYKDRLDIFKLINIKPNFNTEKYIKYYPKTINDEYGYITNTYKTENNSIPYIHNVNYRDVPPEHMMKIQNVNNEHILNIYDKKWFVYGNVLYIPIIMMFITLHNVNTMSTDILENIFESCKTVNPHSFEQLMYFYMVGAYQDVDFIKSILISEEYIGESPCEIYNDIKHMKGFNNHIDEMIQNILILTEL